MKKILAMGLLTLSLTMVLLFGCLSPALAQEPVSATDPVYHGLFGVIVAVDQHQYYTDFMPPGWHPPVINMKLEVINYTMTPVTFDFSDSQRYDFSICNSQGVEVWRWSNGKGFFQVIGQVTIPPGQTIIYSETLSFVDTTGNAMPVDLYTLKGELTATDMQLWVPRVMDGRVSFWHRYVY
jgi:hypothetical protein